jgi:hypothetical protein
MTVSRQASKTGDGCNLEAIRMCRHEGVAWRVDMVRHAGVTAW